ncbi:MAG: hypothetical protein ACLUD2_14415 [Clostridium sp.]
MAKELQKLGAHIIIENKLAVVDGVNAAKGTPCGGRRPARRCCALAVAALAADGTSFLDGYEHVSRGYGGISAVTWHGSQGAYQPDRAEAADASGG